ncbi:MAG: hypothetical protein M3323_09760 [Actinomycetota bacterium]|nr:hypothetical protein [Actinomycetota bacterium]
MKLAKTLIVTAAAGAAFALTAVSPGSAPADRTIRAAARPATPLDRSLHLSVAKLDTGELVAGSDAAVVVRVEAVHEPRWNSTDGRRWTRTSYDSAMDATPLLYRTARVTVEQVLFGPASLAAGDSLTVRLFGDGTPTGAEVDGAGVRFNQISGDVAAGDERVMLLRKEVFPMETDSSQWPETWQLTHHGFASWKLGPDGTATHALSAKTTASTSLMRRIEGAQ